MEVFDQTKHEVYYFSKELADRILFTSMHVSTFTELVVRTNHPEAQQFIGKPAKVVVDVMKGKGFTLFIL